MDSTSALLKQEINQTQQTEHDLAKWKLLVTAALGAGAFGLTGTQGPNRWLLFFIPFVCAYVDLCDYQYRLRVLVIAKFLRESGSDPEMMAYEEMCEKVRGGRDRNFNLGKRAGLGSSLVASLVGPAFYFIRDPNAVTSEPITISRVLALGTWIFSLSLILYFYWDFRHKEDRLSKLSAAPISQHPVQGDPQGHLT